MTGERGWDTRHTWHELLDALCIEQGHLNNLNLAERLCSASGNRSHAAFDTALKNLHNWRQGVHLPQRRNFLLLTRLLDVDRDQALREHWNRLQEQIDTTSAGGRFYLHILAALAEFEREMIRERTVAGMAAAKRRGVQLGRPFKLSADEIAQAIAMVHGGYTRTAIAAHFKVSAITLRRALHANGMTD